MVKKKSVAVADIHVHMNPEIMTEEAVIKMTIEDLEKRLAEVQNAKVNREASEKLYAIYESHMDAGFNEDQAWELLLGSLRSAGVLR
jgi:hypothetical protein